MGFVLKLEGLAGSDILDLCIHARRIAEKLDVLVEFNFNGVKVLVRESDLPTEVARNVMKAMKSKSAHRFATGAHHT